ncbi:hypothetical protein AX774_g3604 [Zancudomyces culisetae]|uniref:Uncharacterized protein n=1 Tax=Zancudomyces culisetae TaxID=1213189 RepID=A0A1R1PPM6_ZANCU|nr:hypothetical protein AX774_g3604 [Zancudomyces culisetae]|eukprot:OMH82908.1 hypothetical protein AX774_g3604 [Zancudomyces culisetae]
MSISSTSDAESTESSSTTIPIGPGSKSLSTAAIVAIALGSVLFLLLILLLLLFMRRRRKRERMAEKQVSNDDGVFDEYDALEDSNADMDGSAITAGLSGKIVTDTKNEDFSTFGGSPPFQDPKAVAGVYGDYELPSIMSSPMVFAGPQRSTRTNSQGSNKSNFAGGGPTKMGSPGSGFVLDRPNHSTSFTELDARIVGKGFRDALDKAPENDLIKSDEEDGQGGDNSTPEHENWRETIAHDRMQRALEQDKSIKVVDLHHKATPFSTAGLQSTKFSVKSDKPLSTTSLSSPDPDAPSDSTDKTEPDT